MPRTITQIPKKPNNDEFLSALSHWNNCKPPYTSPPHDNLCYGSKNHPCEAGLSRRSKYEKESYLRIDFSKAGKVTVYAEFPKAMGLKGKKLGEWPELTLPIARDRAQALAADGLSAESVHQVIEAYEADLLGTC